MKNIKKKLKLLLSKEEGKISKIGIGVMSSFLFFNIVKGADIISDANYKLTNELFDINGDPNPQHQHNVVIKIDNTEPSDVNFEQQIRKSKLVIQLEGTRNIQENAAAGCNWRNVWADIIFTPNNGYSPQDELNCFIRDPASGTKICGWTGTYVYSDISRSYKYILTKNEIYEGGNLKEYKIKACDNLNSHSGCAGVVYTFYENVLDLPSEVKSYTFPYIKILKGDDYESITGEDTYQGCGGQPLRINYWKNII
jgi:hypothetical protein